MCSDLRGNEKSPDLSNSSSPFVLGYYGIADTLVPEEIKHISILGSKGDVGKSLGSHKSPLYWCDKGWGSWRASSW